MVVRSGSREVDPAAACVVANDAHRRSYIEQASPATCAAACGDPAVTDCFLPNEYMSAFRMANQPSSGAGGAGGSGGAGGTAGPVCPDTGGQTVVLRCEVQRTEGEWHDSCPVAGRRPAGLLPVDVPGPGDDLGAYFAQCARLEAASIVAFERLERDLARLGAPQRLRARARKAAIDERRHTAITSALAARFGASPLAPALDPSPREPSALELALENAVEGVVRETFGAAEALWRAEHAADEGVRRAMRRIAIDECAHALLGWDIARWLETQLDARGQARVRRAARLAVTELETSLASLAPDPHARSVAGAPDASEATRLLDRLDTALWRRGPRKIARGKGARRGLGARPKAPTLGGASLAP